MVSEDVTTIVHRSLNDRFSKGWPTIRKGGAFLSNDISRINDASWVLAFSQVTMTTRSESARARRRAPSERIWHIRSPPRRQRWGSWGPWSIATQSLRPSPSPEPQSHQCPQDFRDSKLTRRGILSQSPLTSSLQSHIMPPHGKTMCFVWRRRIATSVGC